MKGICVADDAIRDEILFEGAHLRLIRRAGWELAQRTVARGVVGILARTDDNRLIVVEQFRKPVGRWVIELPAGLAGDSTDAPDEEFAEAARRELLEETGYAATNMRRLTESPPSAGMSDERIVLYRAEGLQRVHSGGGVAGEGIRVHEVPLETLTQWLLKEQESGKLIDIKVWAAPVLLEL